MEERIFGDRRLSSPFVSGSDYSEPSTDGSELQPGRREHSTPDSPYHPKAFDIFAVSPSPIPLTTCKGRWIAKYGLCCITQCNALAAVAFVQSARFWIWQ